jgi:hypothetical protein
MAWTCPPSRWKGNNASGVEDSAKALKTTHSVEADKQNKE